MKPQRTSQSSPVPRAITTEQLVLEPRRAASSKKRREAAPASDRLRIAPRADTQAADDDVPGRVDLTQPLIDVDRVAELLCVKRKRIYELARRPDDPLPSVRIGRAIRFVRAQVEEWVAGQAPK